MPAFGDFFAEARGSRDDGIHVGIGILVAGSVCNQRRAVVWETANTPVSLHGSLPAETETFAEQIRNNADEIVGWIIDDGDFRALRWARSTGSGPWITKEINNEIACPNVILRVYDINDLGSIAGVAEVGTREKAVLLTPTDLEPCPEDVNKDGCVDSTDLNLVRQNQGPCPEGEFCWPDVNWDCVVDSVDYNHVIEAMGQCCGEGNTQMSSDMIDLWLYAGGADALDSGAVTGECVADCVAHPSAADEFSAMMNLLN
jgi:hypothetical protein